MDWRFVGRSEQVERIRSCLDEADPAPLVVVGERGIGRTSVLHNALTQLDEDRNAVLEVRPGDGTPFSSLRHLLPKLPNGHGGREAVRAAAKAVAEHAAGKRPVLLADDADLADHASMLVLQYLNRHAAAFLLLSHPEPARSAHGHDPVDCLRYERGIRTLRLPALSADEVGVVLSHLMDGPVRPATTDALHAATGGNPGLLNDIVVRQDIRSRMARQDGMWRLADSPRGPGAALTCRGTAHLLAAIRDAWGALALGRVEDLCRLATWSGIANEVALTRATVLLLRGHATAGIAVLDAALDSTRAQDAPSVEKPHAVLLRAMSLAFGLRRFDPALEVLTSAAAEAPTHRTTLLAYRAWLLATDGRLAETDSILTGLDHRGDRHAGLFTHTARAIVALGAARYADAVSQLRRALVLAEADRYELPWMQPYLTAYLIDALLLAGRITEATSMAGEFHAAAPAGGWNVAVAMAALTTGEPATGKPAASKIAPVSSILPERQ